MDKKNVHFSKARKVLPKKTFFVTIIEFYGQGSKKIIFNLLRYIFRKIQKKIYSKNVWKHLATF